MPKHRTIFATGTRQDSYDLDHYQRTVRGEDLDYCAKKSGGDGMGYRDKKVGTPAPAQSLEDYGLTKEQTRRIIEDLRHLSNKS
jgi:hypothetical protein